VEDTPKYGLNVDIRTGERKSTQDRVDKLAIHTWHK